MTEPGRFFFRFLAKTRLTFSDWETHQEREEHGLMVKHPAEGAELLVFDRRLERDGFFLHYGLGFDVGIEAPNKEWAQQRAEHLVVSTMGVLTFLEGCYTEAPDLVLSYRYPGDPDAHTLDEYSVVLFDENAQLPTEVSLRRVNLNRLAVFFEHLRGAPRPVRDAVEFSIHWYWKAVGSTDRRDTFINLWVALETLEAPLKALFGMPGSKTAHPQCSHCKETISECPECGDELSYKANSGYTGLKRLEKTLENPNDVLPFGKLHSKRSALVHAGKSLTAKDLEMCAFSTRVLINFAILTLLGLDENCSADAMLMSKQQFRPATKPIRIEFKGSAEVKRLAPVDHPEDQPGVTADYRYRFSLEAGDIVPRFEVHSNQNDVIRELHGEQAAVIVDASQNVREVFVDSPTEA